MAKSEIRRLAKQIYRLPIHVWARFKNELTIEYEGLTLNYATRSPIAKRWFYPRYISGNRLHEPPIAALIRLELDPGSTFFDVGANLGFFTVLAANICTASGGSVHAFELDPSLIPLISDSLRLNDQRAQVCLNCVACTGETGRFHAFRAMQEANPSTNQVVLSKSEEQLTSVQAMTTSLDHYYRSTAASPDLIKMDIEGAEALAVPGMLEMIENIRPNIILEIHPESIQKFGSTPTSLTDMIQKAGDYSEVMEVKNYRRNKSKLDNIIEKIDREFFDEISEDPFVIYFRQ